MNRLCLLTIILLAACGNKGTDTNGSANIVDTQVEHSDTEKTIGQLQKRIEALEAEIKALKADSQGVALETQTMKSQLDMLESNGLDYSNALNYLATEITSLSASQATSASHIISLQNTVTSIGVDLVNVSQSVTNVSSRVDILTAATDFPDWLYDGLGNKLFQEIVYPRETIDVKLEEGYVASYAVNYPNSGLLGSIDAIYYGNSNCQGAAYISDNGGGKVNHVYKKQNASFAAVLTGPTVASFSYNSFLSSMNQCLNNTGTLTAGTIYPIHVTLPSSKWDFPQPLTTGE